MTSDHTSEASVRAWLAAWGSKVAARQFEAARPQFDESVVGFGTKEAAARGLDALERDQWRAVWPKIDDFAFDSDGADVWISPDELMAVIAAAWDSTGTAADGTSFPRGGRATAILRRPDPAAEWQAVHTHFSLIPTDPKTG